MKKFFSLLLAAALLLTLAACGGKKGSGGNVGGNADSNENSEPAYMFYGNEDPIKLGSVSDPLNPDEIYNSITYIPEMFYGNYRVPENFDTDAYIAEVGTMEISEDATHMDGGIMTTIPYGLTAGPQNMNHVLNYITNKNWAELHFVTESGNLITCKAAYEIDGNTIRFNPALRWSYDEQTQFISYEMSDIVWEYTFRFSGPHLTLSQGDKSVTITSRAWLSEDYFFQAEGYLAVGSPTFNDMDEVAFYTGDKVVLNAADSYTYFGEVAAVQENGLVTFGWCDRDGNEYIRQFVYFNCDFNGFVLADRENTYLFTAAYFERGANGLMGLVSFEEQSQLEYIPEETVNEILEKKADLLHDLAQAYEEAGLNVTIDEATGEITLDAAVLFATNSSEISEEGKAMLEQFITIYADVVFSDKYAGFISKIMVEGHTDTAGEYDYNLQLSQERAESVRDYCLSVDTGHTNELDTMLNAVGYSYTDPVYDENGEVDMDASRRVTFRFLINLSGE